jgi:hypothetical protein
MAVSWRFTTFNRAELGSGFYFRVWVRFCFHFPLFNAIFKVKSTTSSKILSKQGKSNAKTMDG